MTDTNDRIDDALKNDDTMEMLSVASEVLMGSRVADLIDRVMTKVRLAKGALDELDAIGPKLREPPQVSTTKEHSPSTRCESSSQDGARDRRREVMATMNGDRPRWHHNAAGRSAGRRVTSAELIDDGVPEDAIKLTELSSFECASIQGCLIDAATSLRLEPIARMTKKERQDRTKLLKTLDKLTDMLASARAVYIVPGEEAQ